MRNSRATAIIGLVMVAALATACSSESATTAAGTTAAAAGASPIAAPATSSGPGDSIPADAGQSPQASSPAAAAADIDACALLSPADASSLVGHQLSSTESATIAVGQDRCTYRSSDNSSDLVVVVYQPGSGVTWQMLNSVLAGTGTVTNVPDVGDQAAVGDIELDVQDAAMLITIQGAGGKLSGDDTRAIAVARAVIAALP